MSGSGATKSIVVIDDAGDSARLLSMLLKRLGYEVHVATSGEAGLEIARRIVPHVIMSDCMMAGALDGYAVAKTVRSDPQFDHTLLVAVTGRSGDEATRQSLEAGFDQHVVKPIDFRLLEQLLRDFEQFGRKLR